MRITGLIYGFYFNEDGSHSAIDTNAPVDFSRKYWLHFDYSNDGTKEWLENHSKLDSTIVNALLIEETRPRATSIKDGLLVSAQLSSALSYNQSLAAHSTALNPLSHHHHHRDLVRF